MHTTLKALFEKTKPIIAMAHFPPLPGAPLHNSAAGSVYASDVGLWNTDCGSVFTHRRAIDACDVDLLFNINAEFASSLDPRSIADIARSVVVSSAAEFICVSGPTTGRPADVDSIKAVKQAVPEAWVPANTGVTVDSVARVLSVADGAVVGTSIKKDGVTWNQVDPERVARFMDVANRYG